MWSINMAKNKVPDIHDEIVDYKEPLVILSRDQNKRYKVSRFSEYRNMWNKKSVGEKVTLIIMFIIFSCRFE